MDLHDFDDVAENYDLYLEEMYRNEDNHEGFLDFYLDFAKEYGKDGVIDIACGTGAVLLIWLSMEYLLMVLIYLRLCVGLPVKNQRVKALTLIFFLLI